MWHPQRTETDAGSQDRARRASWSRKTANARGISDTTAFGVTAFTAAATNPPYSREGDAAANWRTSAQSRAHCYPTT